MRHVPRPDEHRRPRNHSTISELDARQTVVLDHEPRDLAADDLDSASLELRLFGAGQVMGMDEERHVVGPLPNQLGVLDRGGLVPSTPRGWSRTSHPWHTGSGGGLAPTARGRQRFEAARPGRRRGHPVGERNPCMWAAERSAVLRHRPQRPGALPGRARAGRRNGPSAVGSDETGTTRAPSPPRRPESRR